MASRTAAALALLLSLPAAAHADGIFLDGFESGGTCAWSATTPAIIYAVSPPPAPAPLGVAGIVVTSQVRTPTVRYARPSQPRNAPIWFTEAPRAEHVSWRSTRRDLSTRDGSEPGSSVPRAAAAGAPSGLAAAFDAASFDTNALHNDDQGCRRFFVPPDPTGAVGVHHLVDAMNSLVEFYQKDGTQTFVSGLRSFFAPLSPAGFPFDPRVAYDSYADRFVIVSLDKTDVGDGDASNTSRLLVAVSDDGDPNGTWYMSSIDALTTVAGLDRWADYPGLAVDEQAIYVTANLFQFGTCTGSCVSYGGSRLWVIAKAPLYSGGVASVSTFDPYALVPTNATTTQPAMMMQAPPGTTGTYLTSYGPFTDGTDEFVQVVRIDDPLGAPTFTPAMIAIGDVDRVAESLSGAPQAGTSRTLDAGDRRTLSAVWRGNSLWTTMTVLPPSGADAGQPTAYWLRLTTQPNGDVSGVEAQGQISGEIIASGAHTWRAAVGIGASGTAFFGFAASAPSIFPGAYWTLQSPAGMTDPLPLHAGEDWYVRTLGNPDQDQNRWGDYSTVAIDPVDDSAWIFNEYAATRGTATQIPPYSPEDGRWATTWGNVLDPLVLTPFSGPIRIGGTALRLVGSGFSSGSVIELSVSTRYGNVDYGPFTPSAIAPTQLTWTPPASISLGNGWSTLRVVNTDQGSRVSNTICQDLLGPPSKPPPSITAVNGHGLAAADCSVPYAYVNTVLAPGSTCTLAVQNAATPYVNVFDASGTVTTLPLSGGPSNWQFVVPSRTPAGPASLQVANSPFTGNYQSNTVAVVIGAP